MVLAVTWAKQQELIGQDAIWYEQRWDRGTVFENHKAKLVWDFEFHLRKTTTARRPDLILELRRTKRYGFVTWRAHTRITLRLRE